MKATDLALNRLLGIAPAPAGAMHVLEMPFTAQLHNHLGTMHAAAQFALAEAASAECLQRHFSEVATGVFAVVRGVELKFRKPATGDLLAYGAPDDETRTKLPAELAARGRAVAVILIDLKDRAGTLTFHAKFEWFISRAAPAPKGRSRGRRHVAGRIIRPRRNAAVRPHGPEHFQHGTAGGLGLYPNDRTKQ